MYRCTEYIILGSNTAAFNIFTNGEVQLGTVLVTTTNLRIKGSCRRLTLNDEEACFGGRWGQNVEIKQNNVFFLFFLINPHVYT